jgi:hypothetical protein
MQARLHRFDVIAHAELRLLEAGFARFISELGFGGGLRGFLHSALLAHLFVSLFN